MLEHCAATPDPRPSTWIADLSVRIARFAGAIEGLDKRARKPFFERTVGPGALGSFPFGFLREIISRVMTRVAFRSVNFFPRGVDFDTRILFMKF